jgi:hypothetical protein
MYGKDLTWKYVEYWKKVPTVPFDDSDQSLHDGSCIRFGTSPLSDDFLTAVRRSSPEGSMTHFFRPFPHGASTSRRERRVLPPWPLRLGQGKTSPGRRVPRFPCSSPISPWDFSNLGYPYLQEQAQVGEVYFPSFAPSGWRFKLHNYIVKSHQP